MFVTTRILVVDLLSGRLSGRAVSGCVVLNAHRVTETSGEGFAVRLFRAANRNGFVRAFSDQPVSFLGFSKVSACNARPFHEPCSLNSEPQAMTHVASHVPSRNSLSVSWVPARRGLTLSPP